MLEKCSTAAIPDLWVPQQLSRTRSAADLLVLGAIATGVAGEGAVGAMAVKDGRVSALGSAEELASLAGPQTEIMNAGNGVIVPGFIEPHMHLWASVLTDSWIDCSNVEYPTFDGVVNRLRTHAQTVRPGEWISGQLFDPSQYPGEPALTVDILDQISRDSPIAILNANMHYLYVNSKAFEVAGITYETPDPPSGRYYRMDGKFTGVVGEIGGILSFLSHQKQMTHADQTAGLRTIMNKAAAAGVTSVRDALNGAIVGTAEIGVLQQMNAASQLPTRVTTSQLSKLGNSAWADAGVTPMSGDDMVRAVAWKIISDGANQGRSGFLREPYLGSNERGESNMDAVELTALIKEGHDAGWQVMTHANGDAAIDLTLDAYEAALDGTSGLGLRHRIEHCSITHDDQLTRMAELGISPSFLMNHLYFWGRIFRDNVIGRERAALLDRVGAAVRAGLRPSLHSDYSVTRLQPLLSARTAVLRNVREDGDVLGPADRVSADVALRAVTADAAWQVHRDDLGSLAVGQQADFAVLSENPWTSDPEMWPDIDVYETRISGVTAWSS
jgi:predicted amidohydrolase YtcJ